ncbi:MAG: peptide-methionine (R)-S-oxide reductase MsrB [Acidimicrobiia bacterium]|nr:peptide-methionine (R)-S-oxide reductase MsrB [Acidimicrobiia bacterium]MDH4309810.1 peptide-methionine (R)-S-oxide reductase MsrB [Acidimicrobiia bacterium]MDH5292822.1 peptide-methionine (R)-S-oxide reductase MsrB [Acidimicrobiia bacterium]MDH5521864.1 peptide-methionine (R)-S-oxide reductase MsrB [Acidimicrobiia bacterium]
MNDDSARDLSDAEWRDRLDPDRYMVLRQGATEPPFSGELLGSKAKGRFVCAGCRAELFSSDTKYDSGSGWPSFYAPIADGRVEESLDTSHGMVRTEISCAGCGGHLGHLFEDGPQPTGLRYCINSLSLEMDEGD